MSGSAASGQGNVLREVAGASITQSDLEARLRLSGAWFEGLAELSDEALVASAATNEGLSVSDDELQAEFDGFRRSRELEKADDTKGWLASAGLTLEQVENCLEAGVLRSKLADKLIGDDQIEQYYNQNPNEFAFARISHIVVESDGAADELALSVREEGEDFGKLAGQHSVDKATGCGGGFLGLITRDDTAGLGSDVADRIFSASAGDVVGPFAVNGGHCLVKALEVGRRPLDDDLKASLRHFLLAQRIAEMAKG